MWSKGLLERLSGQTENMIRVMTCGRCYDRVGRASTSCRMLSSWRTMTLVHLVTYRELVPRGSQASGPPQPCPQTWL